jgi:hypothetical protein
VRATAATRTSACRRSRTRENLKRGSVGSEGSADEDPGGLRELMAEDAGDGPEVLTVEEKRALASAGLIVTRYDAGGERAEIRQLAPEGPERRRDFARRAE